MLPIICNNVILISWNSDINETRYCFGNCNGNGSIYNGTYGYIMIALRKDSYLVSFRYELYYLQSIWDKQHFPFIKDQNLTLDSLQDCIERFIIKIDKLKGFL